MNDQMTSQLPSAERNVWIWIILGALLVIGVIVAVGSLALITATQQPQLPTGSQSAPASR